MVMLLFWGISIPIVPLAWLHYQSRVGGLAADFRDEIGYCAAAVMVALWIVLLIRHRSRSIRLKGMTDTSITLTGVSDLFISSLQEARDKRTKAFQPGFVTSDSAGMDYRFTIGQKVVLRRRHSGLLGVVLNRQPGLGVPNYAVDFVDGRRLQLSEGMLDPYGKSPESPS
jgi:hypothetical protein